MERKDVVRIAILSSGATLLGALVIFIFVAPHMATWSAKLQVAWEAYMVTADVGKVVRLPKDETPKVAVVANPSELTAQDPFFALAQGGDVVLMYENSGLIILFDPKQDKVRNMALMATSSDPVTF